MLKKSNYDREYRKNWRYKRWLEVCEHLGGKCAECGSTDQLQVDHIDPATNVDQVCSIWLLSRERLERELPLCQLLCAPCHHVKSSAERALRRAYLH